MNMIDRIEQNYQIHTSDRGWVNVELYNFQKKMLTAFNTGINTIVHSSRQMGLTSVMQLHAIDYCSTNPNTRVAFIGEGYGTNISNVFNKIKDKDWVAHFGKKTIRLINGSTIHMIDKNDTRTAFKGMTLDKVFIDHAGWLHQNVDEFITSLCENWYCCIRQLIVGCTGTNTDYNVFEALWNMWEDNNNGIKMKIPYNYHPERDCAWFEDQVKMMGSTSAELEFNCGRHQSRIQNLRTVDNITFSSVSIVSEPEENCRIKESEDNKYKRAMRLVEE
jgi:hypothetical protein